LALLGAFGILAYYMVLGGWVLNNVSKSIDRLDVDVRAMPHMYVNREDYREDMRDIKDMLTKIFDRLEAKQDK